MDSMEQKRSYPVARSLAARATFSDADAAPVVDAYTSLASAEKKVMTAVSSHSLAATSHQLISARMCIDHRRFGRNRARGPSPADVRQPPRVPAGKPGAPPYCEYARDRV
jgi:hypothetical protein